MTVTVFGYLILISIDFYHFNSLFLLSFSFDGEDNYVKHSRQCLSKFPITLKFIKNTLLQIIFSTLFSVFGQMWSIWVFRV